MEKLTGKRSSWLDSNWLLGFLLLMVAVVVWGTLRQGHDWGDDFAAYIMQAQSIVTGTIPEFMEENRFTIAESSVGFGPYAYPWGTPLLLAPIIYLKGARYPGAQAAEYRLFLRFPVGHLVWDQTISPPCMGLALFLVMCVQSISDRLLEPYHLRYPFLAVYDDLRCLDPAFDCGA